MLMAVPGSSPRVCVVTPGIPKKISDVRVGISCWSVSAATLGAAGCCCCCGWAWAVVVGAGTVAGCTGAERTVLTGASVSLTRSRVLVATTVTGSSSTAAVCACAGQTPPAFINATVDTPKKSAFALRVQPAMTTPHS